MPKDRTLLASLMGGTDVANTSSMEGTGLFSSCHHLDHGESLLGTTQLGSRFMHQVQPSKMELGLD